MTLKEKIMEAAIDEFNEKGIKFTMDELAKHLSMSKKTIYSVFDDKEALFTATVNYCFDRIQVSKAEILKDDTIEVVDKIGRILIAFPERYREIDWRKIYAGKEKYPKAYKAIRKRLESDWNYTIALIEQGIEEKKIKPVCIPVFKVMVQATFEQFIDSPVLIQERISYQEALEEMVKIVMSGISAQ